MRLTLILSAFLLLVTIKYSSSQSYPVKYLSPLPGSGLISKQTEIIIKPYKPLSANSKMQDNLVNVAASQSGVHTGKLLLSSDNKSLIFKPSAPFVLSDTVH